MRNIGPVSRRWLAEIEIYTRDDLQQVGAMAAYRHIKESYPQRANRNLLWALLGAELDQDWRVIPTEVKAAALRDLD